MADLREVFPGTVDASTGAGVAPISRVEGDASASQAGQIAFGFKDSTGNVVLPQLRSDGSFAASIAPEPEFYGYAAHVGGSSTTVDLVTLVPSLSKKYHEFKLAVSCMSECLFTLVHIDDVGGTPVESVLGVWRCGPGQYTVTDEMPGYVDTTSGTGVQNFVLRAKNLFAARLSDINGSVSCKEEL